MKLPRWHAVEWEDLPWCPTWLRNEATEVLVRVLNFAGWPGTVAKLWGPWLEQRGFPTVTDCCSGAAGPMPGLLRLLPQLKVHLTDRYPNLPAWRALQEVFSGRVGSTEVALDARCLPPGLPPVLSFFNSFHHLRPAEAAKVIAEVVHRKQSLCVFEVVDRHPLRLLGVSLVPLFALLTAAFQRPFRWRRFHPLVPALLLWDGLVSCFRVYQESDWENLLAQSDPQREMEWTFERVRLGWTPLYCLCVLGHPRQMFVPPAGQVE